MAVMVSEIPDILKQRPNLVVCGKNLVPIHIRDNQCMDFVEFLALNFTTMKIYRSSKDCKIYVVGCGDCPGKFKREYYELRESISECTGLCFQQDCDPVRLVSSSRGKHCKYNVAIRGGQCDALYFYVTGDPPCDVLDLFKRRECYSKEIKHKKYKHCLQAPYSTVKNAYCADCNCEPLVN